MPFTIPGQSTPSNFMLHDQSTPPDDNKESTAAVAAVLAARNDFEALGVHPTASSSLLRRCYLQMSDLVRPDKNSHPNAKQAFQKVGRAWIRLTTQHSRDGYDAEMENDNVNISHELSLKEAFEVHAMVTANASWREGGQEDDLPEMSRPQYQHPPHLAIPPVQESAQGLALAVGLWATGHLVTAAGLPATGAFARRVAVMQGAGYVLSGTVSALRDPEVCQKLTVEPFQQVTSAIGSSIAEQLGRRAGGLFAEDVGMPASHTDAFSYRSSSSSSEPALPFAKRISKRALAFATHWVDLQSVSKSINSAFEVAPCLGKRKRSAPDPNRVMEAGTLVKIVDLKSATNLNGKVGVVLSFNDNRVRYQVKIFSVKVHSVGSRSRSHPSLISRDDVKFIRVDNMTVLPSTSCSQPIVQSQFI